MEEIIFFSALTTLIITGMIFYILTSPMYVPPVPVGLGQHDPRKSIYTRNVWIGG